ncbi:MAG: PSD1 and planctomycete cytochrome C domain-containing protein [Gemmataceae bacterium]
MNRRKAVLFIAFCMGLANAPLSGSEPKSPIITPQQIEFFESRVRPVLIENCFSCHGPKKQMAGLRLDSLAALLKGGDDGPVVKPGLPDDSLLIQAIRQVGDLKMPPKKKLKTEEAESLAAWVTMGVPWPDSAQSKDAEAGRKHWAFQPVRNPKAPQVKDGQWPRSPIDRFILTRLEEKKLAPSAPADRRTLLRRVTFDLIGLPPTPDEITAFEKDVSADAYAKVVDRLLASPHYGERWGRHWLDVARYADTKGYVFFEESEYPWAYTYRDYVVRSFNEDLPYDQFIVQQLAADRLDLGKDRRPLTALGFLTVGGHFMSNPHDIIDDRIDVVTRGLMGLTVTCARCHDHKFDPIPTKDYYSLYGVFASSVEPRVPPVFADPPATPAYEAFAKELKSREGKLAAFLKSKQDEVSNAAKTRVAEYLLAAHSLRDRPKTEDFMLIADGGDLNPAMVIRWQAYLNRTRKKHHPVFAPWHAFAALAEREFADKASAICLALASQKDPERPINDLVAKAFMEKPPQSLAEVAQRYADLLNATEKLWQESVKRAADTHGAPPASLPDPIREELRQVFHGADAPPNLTAGLFNSLDLLPDRPSQAKLDELRKAVDQWRATGPGAPPRAMVLEDAPVSFEPRVFLRGNPNQLGDAVPRQFCEVLSGSKRTPFKEGSGRLELARAIADKNNPLTARVLVNRVWMHHFGAGLVRTPSDFGLRSDPATHPELLDYLATYFVEHGWSIKKLHRHILLSAVYQQKSDDRPEPQRLDPSNRLLWKMNRRRLDFEATRDALLAVSGKLDRTIGGPSVKDIFAPAATRRTLYGYVDRLKVPGLYRSFDYPGADATNPQRDQTTVPQQALFMMNNPFVIECCKSLRERLDVESVKETEEKVCHIYRLLYGRPPAKEELVLAQDFLTKDKDPTLGWQRLIQALIMSNEFSFLD